MAQCPQLSSGNVVVGNLLSPRKGFQGEVFHVFARCVEDRNRSLNYPVDKCTMAVVGHVCYIDEFKP